MQAYRKLKELRKNLKLQISFLKRRFIAPALPKNHDGKILLHIGCGKKNSPEFINIDAQPFAHIHIVTDNLASLSDFSDESVDLIYMCHVLEHIKRSELEDVLVEMKRTLKTGGVLRLSVPDFDQLIKVYNDSGNNINSISRQLMGQYSEYNTHYCVFNSQQLSDLLKGTGFQKVVSWDRVNCEHHNFTDNANRTIKVNEKEYKISLNLEATK
jgi:predicted SAM-dependent methyltransferase